MIENRGLRAEVRRLHVENSDLLRRVRFSDSNAHYMRNQVGTSRGLGSLHENLSLINSYQVVSNVADRAELLRRLEKTETQVEL